MEPFLGYRVPGGPSESVAKTEEALADALFCCQELVKLCTSYLWLDVQIGLDPSGTGRTRLFQILVPHSVRIETQEASRGLTGVIRAGPSKGSPPELRFFFDDDVVLSMWVILPSLRNCVVTQRLLSMWNMQKLRINDFIPADETWIKTQHRVGWLAEMTSQFRGVNMVPLIDHIYIMRSRGFELFHMSTPVLSELSEWGAGTPILFVKEDLHQALYDCVARIREEFCNLHPQL